MDRMDDALSLDELELVTAGMNKTTGMGARKIVSKVVTNGKDDPSAINMFDMQCTCGNVFKFNAQDSVAICPACHKKHIIAG